ncbi:MAG: hypothetical protein ACI977_000547 [Candidatus Nanohaloarchaea archaeon]|jgi:lipopolysaccharide export LptBFGC system permease protein LptF
MDLKQKIQEVEYEYTLDQNELGKILAIVSLTITLFSVYSIMSLQPAMEEAQTAEDRLSQLDEVINSQQFNQSLNAMEDLQTTSVGEDIDYALQTFQGMQTTVNDQQKIYENLENANTRYQWLFLIGLLGLVSGVSIRYV